MFDEAALMKRLMGDRDLARTLVGSFLEDIPKQLAALESHLNAGDAAAAERQAHSITGAAATVGSDAVRRVASEMEQAGRAGDLQEMSVRLSELAEQFQAAGKAMQNMKSCAQAQRNRNLS